MPTLEQLDALVSPDPTDQFPNVPADKVLSWQDRAMHCLRSICIKQALYLGLVSHTKVPQREEISSALATFVAESKDNIDEDRINAFLLDQFAAHGLDIEPNGKFLASPDFLTAFGFKQVFQSSIATHLLKFCEALETTKALPPFPDQCVFREVLPVLAGIAQEIAASE